MTDKSFPLHDEATAPDAARPALAATRADFGMIPNLERTMATAPALLETYTRGWELFETTSLTPIERQVVYQTANFENDCAYCVPWHTLLSLKAGMADEDIDALRQGRDLSDPRLAALQRFARRLIHARGNVAPADLQAFFAAGHDGQAALEVVLGLAIKTMSNFTNTNAGTPLDQAGEKHRWQNPVSPVRDD